MGSLLGEVGKKKAMWLYPKVMGFNPPERWGHSACFANGFLYIFGGCCGGLHFGDVLVLNLNMMAWNNLVTMGHGPGPRDSHSSVIVGHRMIVFGGTNGSKKVNELHILDLGSREWMRPNCKGVPPSPRESHTATLIGDKKIVIFGGSGEGGANYLNDLHVLDLKTMWWTSPEVTGDIPIPRDSHSAVAIGNRLFVYGGDCGDRYQGDVDMLDMDSMTWSKLAVEGPSPGVRAGHTAVNIGTKVFVISGIGDKKYYNDIWVLDIRTCSWSQLEIRGQQPQGRFSHTAIVTDSDIAIYGGCGEDERPLNELLILQLGAEHPNGRYNISMCKIFGSHCNQENRKFIQEAENNILQETIFLGDNLAETESKQSFPFGSDILHPKRRRTTNLKACEMESEPEEHSLSLSQHSSPSHSDQEQTPVKKASTSSAQLFPLFKKQSQQVSSNWQPNYVQAPKAIIPSDPNLNFLGEYPNQSKPHPHVIREGRFDVRCSAEPGHFRKLIGAEVHGKVDGGFDSGYLMTATVNGRIFRGVLFAPVHEGAMVGQNPASQVAQPNPRLNHININPNFVRNSQHVTESTQSLRQAHANASSVVRTQSSLGRGRDARNELQGVVLTLGGPGSGS